MTVADAEFDAWFRLLDTPGVGRATARRLLSTCGSPQAVFESAPVVLRQCVGPEVAQALAHPAPGHAQRLQAARDWLDGGPQRHVLTLGDPDYPRRLLQTPDPPLLLYVMGRVELLGWDALAIVGSRHASAQGEDNARAFAAALSTQGLLVCSGLARGIDAAAHLGALDAGCPTLAVIGTGADRIYPAQHAALARRIATEGVLISEFAPGTPPRAEHFPQRNRILAGLTLGTLVVEAALRSGSLITARLATEAGREVFAIPGSIHSPQARGCHALIKQGAKLVESAEDILEELRVLRAHPPETAPAEHDDDAAPASPLLQALGHDPVTLDALMARTGCDASALMAELMSLELDGLVARLPGGLYQRRHAG